MGFAIKRVGPARSGASLIFGEGVRKTVIKLLEPGAESESAESGPIAAFFNIWYDRLKR
jgi:hypothetical protein